MTDLIPAEVIAGKIFLVRGQKVMFDRDLARLYGVSTGRLNEQVRRNLKRFPADFMFQLTKEEFENWKSQFAISNSDKMGLRRTPLVFTEQGVAMLSGVLNSERAIMVNISIMRVFSKLKQLALSHSELLRKVETLERKYGEHDKKIGIIFDALKKMLTLPEPKKPGKIGFLGK